jgi:alpha-tubulin suppressor-like RCC1 family protein
MFNLPSVNVGQGHTFKSISSGTVTCAVLNDGAGKCWGLGFDGQLGQPGSEDVGRIPELLAGLASLDLGTARSIKSLDIEYGHACAGLDNGEVKCWGSNDSGQLGIGSTASKGSLAGEMGDALHAVALGGKTARQVATGAAHTCAILSDGTVKCWGANTRGQLGLGDTRARGASGGVLEADATVNLSF